MAIRNLPMGQAVTGEKLKAIQRRLNDALSTHYPIEEDGLNGRGTRGAVAFFQSLMGLPISGHLDSKTLQLLTPMINRISEKGLALIKQFEGFRSKPYRDAVGVPTIGYGLTHYGDGRQVKMTDKALSEAEADKMLREVVKVYEQDVDASIGAAALNQNQFDALVSFTYNLGAANLRNSTLLRKLRVNPNDPSIRGEFMKWRLAGNQELEGLKRRRQAEADLYFS